MADYYGIVLGSVPDALNASHEGYALRSLSTRERTAIEDALFSSDKTQRLPESVAAVTLPNSATNSKALRDLSTLSEFALALLGPGSVTTVVSAALFNGTKCSAASNITTAPDREFQLSFPDDLSTDAVAQWLHRCHSAHKASGSRLTIAASRYLRFVKSPVLVDGLLDLCISLESLVDAQTEISFRFSVCLTKAIGYTNGKALAASRLLADLYNLRSKLVHGDPSASKAMTKIGPSLGELEFLARRMLVTYVLYLSDHSKKDWAEYLKYSLFN